MVKNMFAEEDQLRDMEGFKKGSGYFEVKCGCTSKKYGDSVGKLRVYATGKFLISCECRPECEEGKLTPYDFEKHSGKEGTRRWKNHIWVILNSKKVPLAKTAILKYYKHGSNAGMGGSTRQFKHMFHRDEFITCSECKIERRFRLRTAEECRIYHDALIARRWRCDQFPSQRYKCNSDAERPGRKSHRGCPRTPSCKGCTTCVCFGCLKCRFVDCKCRTCVDYMRNAEP
ncbi:putative Protein ULTRAPETALA2 [Corchorus olitorius]|uniref:SAND domain-containing protein n=1 Tax=Corchorus olitorius TaxID=93759 RepID=A0A1R3KC09_9ROSI|nr:putative Protein ULTRAPETALA2 [Corchorus olitorius]